MKILIFLIAIYLRFSCAFNLTNANIHDDRSFVIDYENNRFLKDQQPFRYISGSLHYYRVPNEYWEDRLRKYKKAGLNTVQTYIEWSLHEPVKGHYNFEDDANLFKFIELAQKNDLLVILRAGPYECAERDNGGLPYWLKQLNSNKPVKVRTSDRLFMEHVEDWFNYLLPKLKKYLYKYGGPVIMIQIENEYGSYFACDFNYQIQLKNLIEKNLNKDVILFTTDGNGDNYFKCGKIASVLPAIDFGTGVDPIKAFKTLRNHLPSGPLINNEFYPGWLDHWAEKHNTITSKATCDTLDSILTLNASVNIYMMHGGTNFGFSAGANSDNSGKYQPQPTSYDYDAPINEYGNLTQKYFDIQKIISQYSPTEDIDNNDFVQLIVPPPVELSLLKQNLLEILLKQKPKKSDQTLTFETLGVQYGYVLYKTTINFKPTVPIQLTLKNLKDRAYIYVDNVFQGILDRAVKIETAPVIAKKNSELMILVENQGRVNFGDLTGETKGISEVYLGSQKLEGNWQHYGTYDWEKIYEQVNSLDYQVKRGGNQQYKPRFFKGEFVLNEDPKDTLIDLSGWSKGVAFINGHNLGRYWPVAGPQVSLYVPGVWLIKGSNTIILLEKEEDNCRKNNCSISFTDKHMIDSEVPYSN